MSSTNNNGQEFDVYHLYSAFRKRIKLLLGIILVGVVFGFLLTAMKENIYKTSILATSTVLENHELAHLINKLQKIIAEDDIPSLSKALNIPQDTTSNLVKIKAFTSDSVDKNLELRLWTKSPTLVPVFMEGIKNYCVHSDYANRLKTIQKQSLERIIHDYKRKLENLDTMQANIERVITGKSKINSSIIISDIYSNYARMREKLERKKKRLELLSIVEYYDDPYISETPESPNLMLNLIIAFVVSTIAAVFLIVFLAMIDYFRHNAPNRNL